MVEELLPLVRGTVQAAVPGTPSAANDPVEADRDMIPASPASAAASDVPVVGDAESIFPLQTGKCLNPTTVKEILRVLQRDGQRGCTNAKQSVAHLKCGPSPTLPVLLTHLGREVQMNHRLPRNHAVCSGWEVMRLSKGAGKRAGPSA